MKKYFCDINTDIKGSEIKNTIELSEDNTALLNNLKINYDFKFISENVMIIRINNKNFFLTVNSVEDSDLIEVNIDSVYYTLSCKSELDLLKEKMSLNKTGNKLKKEIKSPMPGIIKSINVLKDQKVLKGEILLVLEAMKMENEIKAVSDCIIKKINVNVLSSVEKNELLIELE